jgi:hypothetical protein
MSLVENTREQLLSNVAALCPRRLMDTPSTRAGIAPLGFAIGITVVLVGSEALLYPIDTPS